jgi:ribosomal protein S27E
LKAAGWCVVEGSKILRCGDLASGFVRLQCPDCGHERLLAFTCKTRNFYPACHQRRVLSTGESIANSVCREVPHRQFDRIYSNKIRGMAGDDRPLLDLRRHSGMERASRVLNSSCGCMGSGRASSLFRARRPRPSM